MATGTVTLEKSYFETLLRRAQFHTSGVDFTTPVNLPMVTIPKLDHDSLLNIAREYANLRRNLYKGGVADETLAILINDDGPVDPNDEMTSFASIDVTSESTAFQTQRLQDTPQLTSATTTATQDYTYGRNDIYNGRGHSNGVTTSNNWDDYSVTPDGHADGHFEGMNANGTRQQNQNKHPQFAKQCQRSILLANLPDGCTHADIVEVVQGGMLLDIYLRSNDRSCVVSFLEEDQARDFFHHAKRNDLYIRSKRVEIRWHDRQFILPGHVANKVGIGATRNLVIRNASPRHTEDMIREDLEHIHNLVVISVRQEGTNVHISTNSVHNAMFARTCMMSRGPYKGTKVDWDIDECAEMLPKPQKNVHKESALPKKAAPAANRFELLNLGEGEDSSLDGDHDSSFQSAFSPIAGITV